MDFDGDFGGALPFASLPLIREFLGDASPHSFSLDGLELPDKIIRPIIGVDWHSLEYALATSPRNEQPSLGPADFMSRLTLYFLAESSVTYDHLDRIKPLTPVYFYI